MWRNGELVPPMLWIVDGIVNGRKEKVNIIALKRNTNTYTYAHWHTSTSPKKTKLQHKHVVVHGTLDTRGKHNGLSNFVESVDMAWYATSRSCSRLTE